MTGGKRRLASGWGTSLAIGGKFLFATGLLCSALCERPAALASTNSQTSMPTTAISFTPISFADLPGWTDDDHLAAWKAFLVSCGAVLKARDHDQKLGSAAAPQDLVDTCLQAVAISNSKRAQTREGARRFFEAFPAAARERQPI